MSSPERLNVLLSRARNGLIIIGNSETFLKSRSGKEIWSKFFDMIKQQGYFYEGLPVRCEQHHEVKKTLKLPEDFERLCPDGGCSERWFVPFPILLDSADCLDPWLYSGIAMNCGRHICPRKCHRLQGHNDLACAEKVQTKLACGHSITQKCHLSKAPPDACFSCKLAERKAEADKEAENGAGTSDRSSTSSDPRPPTSPTSPWRDRQTLTATPRGGWRGGPSTNVFNNYLGRGRGGSTDTYKNGLFGRQRPQFDPSESSRGGFSRGSWRSGYSKW